MFDDQAEILETRFDEVFQDLVRVIWDGTRQVPAIGVPFVRFTQTWISSILVAGESHNGVWRESGIITVEIYTPHGEGAKRCYEIADVIKGIYLGWMSGGMTTKTPYYRRVGDEKEWFHINVFVPFVYDHQVRP